MQEHVQADGRIQRTEVMLPPLLPPNSCGRLMFVNLPQISWLLSLPPSICQAAQGSTCQPHQQGRAACCRCPYRQASASSEEQWLPWDPECFPSYCNVCVCNCLPNNRWSTDDSRLFLSAAGVRAAARAPCYAGAPAAAAAPGVVAAAACSACSNRAAMKSICGQGVPHKDR